MRRVLARHLNRLRIAGRYVADGRLDELWYAVGNRLRKIDLEHVSVEDLGLSPDRAHFHSSSGGADCAAILSSISVPPGSVALDYGSGKGSGSNARPLPVRGDHRCGAVRRPRASPATTSPARAARSCGSCTATPPLTRTSIASRTSTCL